MSEMVERVARALCCPDGCAGDTGSGRPCDIRSEDAMAMKQARAAIEAMRKPTDEMRDAGFNNNFQRYADAAWEAMIDAAVAA